MNDLFSPASSMYRTVHAIGQGAFHSEIFHSGNHCVFCCVYDCGTSSPDPDLGERLDRCLRCIPISNKQDLFTENPKHPIDILFISHLDSDHVNGISSLKNTHAISRVVLPLLDDECKMATFLSGVAAGLHGMDLNDFKSLVFQPEMVFGGSTHILRVEPIPLGSQGGRSDNLDSFDIEDLSESKDIPSFQPLKSSQLPRWCFIPFCFDEKERQKLFLDKLRQCPMLKEDIKDKICKNAPTELDWVENKENLKILKCVYQSLQNGTNGNSLLLYSGPEQSGGNIAIHRYFPENNNPRETDKRKNKAFEYPEPQDSFCRTLKQILPSNEDFQITYSGPDPTQQKSFAHIYSQPSPSNRAGCLYLGDMNLNAGGGNQESSKVINCIKKRLGKNNLENLDMIQIPHHGSKHSFHDDLLDLAPSVGYYFLSHGAKNRYKHPHKPVVKALDMKGKTKIMPSESDPDSCTQYLFTDRPKHAAGKKNV